MKFNVGRTITDFYCQGYFGRDYDLAGSEILAEGDEYLVIRKPNGVVITCNFQSWDYNRDERGNLLGGINNLSCLDGDERQEMIDNWCKI